MSRCGAPPGSQRRMTAVSSAGGGDDAAARIRNKSGKASAPRPNAPAPRKRRRVIGPGQRGDIITGGTPAATGRRAKRVGWEWASQINIARHRVAGKRESPVVLTPYLTVARMTAEEFRRIPEMLGLCASPCGRYLLRSWHGSRRMISSERH